MCTFLHGNPYQQLVTETSRCIGPGCKVHVTSVPEGFRGVKLLADHGPPPMGSKHASFSECPILCFEGDLFLPDGAGLAIEKQHS
jgi:hypothetical protein